MSNENEIVDCLLEMVIASVRISGDHNRELGRFRATIEKMREAGSIDEAQYTRLLRITHAPTPEDLVAELRQLRGEAEINAETQRH